MVPIEKVEIKYFRSIYSATLEGLQDLTVLSGKNDCGKSNFLRALNLFFNNETDWRMPMDFTTDFCRKRLQECRSETIKGKQFIQVKVHFVRGNRYAKSLPDKFWVSRTWNRDSLVPVVRNSLNAGNLRASSLDRAQASIQRYLSTIRFEYVPAVKDRRFFTYSLGTLQDAILQSKSDASLKDAVSKLNESVQQEAVELRKEFRAVSDVDVDIHLPVNLEELFRAFAVTTGGDEAFPLSVRGDGIQCRFLPSLLHHVALRSDKYFIWGFEEPENCLEHSLATSLAKHMATDYAIESQIIVTSHSPAFISLQDGAKLLRAYREDGQTRVAAVGSASSRALDDDLGLIELQKEYQAEYIRQLDDTMRAMAVLEEAAKQNTLPLVLVEGKTDVTILSEAWKRLRKGVEIPFRLESCDVSDGNNPALSMAGCGVLQKALESCRVTLPKTIGLFDYDEAGYDAFKKVTNSFELAEFSACVKINKGNQHVAAVIYPEVPGKEAYRNAINLELEFLFPESALTKEVDGHGLVLAQKLEIRRIGKTETKIETTEPHYRDIKDGKAHFADEVVPTLDDGDFTLFEPVFTLIEQVLGKLQ